MSFKRTKDDVEEILKYSENARADDMALYCYYVNAKTEGLKLSFFYLQKVFVDRAFRIKHGIAPYETVSRARRKLQADNPELRPAVETIQARKESEKAYKEYFRKERGNE